jgi:glutaredoxin
MDIKLYGASWCGGCKKAKSFLDSNNVNYIYADVGTDEQALEDLRATGLSSIPVLVVDGVVHSGLSEELKETIKRKYSSQ